MEKLREMFAEVKRKEMNVGEIKSIEEAIHVKEECMERRGKELDIREEEIKRRETAMCIREEKMEGKNETVHMTKECIERRHKELDIREEEIERREKAMHIREEKFEGDEEKMLMGEECIERRHKELDIREKEVEERDIRISTREECIERKGRKLDIKEECMERRCKEFDIKEKEIGMKYKAALIREEEIKERYEAIRVKEEYMNRRYKELYIREDCMERRGRELDIKDKRYTEKEIERRRKEKRKRTEENGERKKRKLYHTLMEMENLALVVNKEQFECPICFSDIKPGDGMILQECLHTFCKECLENAIKFSETAEVKCPYVDEDYSCASCLLQKEIKSLLGPENFQHYLQKSMNLAERQAADSFHCKTPDCHGWCFYDGNVNTFVCPACKHTNCMTCSAIHEELDCRQFQADSSKEGRKTWAYLSNMLKRGRAMRCPRCGVILMKKEGCDLLTCSMCKTEICWVTKQQRWGPLGRGDTSEGCRCNVNGVKCHPNCNYCH